MKISFVVLALVVSMLSGCSCGAPRTELPTYRAPRIAGVEIDGDLSEWGDVPFTETFVGTMDGRPGYMSVRAQLAWDDEALYVAASIPDGFLVSSYPNRDDHLWEQDCLELMIDRDGEGLGEGYVELQISPSNVVFDTWFDRYRFPPPVGHIGWESGMQTAVVLHGTPGDDEADAGYDVEARIPFGALRTAPNLAIANPVAGDTLRVAIYVLDAQREGAGALAWSPPLVGDFHVPERMGRVILEP